MSRPDITIRRPGLVPALTSLLPTAAFLLVDGWLGLVPAMTAASALTIVLVVVRRVAGRRVGIVLPLTLSYVVVKAVAGVLTQSHVVYFGAGVALACSPGSPSAPRGPRPRARRRRLAGSGRSRRTVWVLAHGERSEHPAPCSTTPMRALHVSPAVAGSAPST